MKNAKRLTLCGMLAAVAVVLSLVERMFPLDAIVPVPGVKLGLANVVTLFALTRLSARDAFAIVVTRVAISSLLMGSVSAFLFSLFGGLLSLVVMGILKNWAVIAYLPFLLVMSVPLGLVTGLTCSVVLHHLKKIDFGA